MFQRNHNKVRRFRRRPNGRNDMQRSSSQMERTNSFTNGQPRTNYRPSLSVEKSFEKYSSLAREAMSSGDKTLSENYLQHADHFMRIIEERNRNKAENKPEIINKITSKNNNPSENTNNQEEESKNKV